MALINVYKNPMRPSVTESKRGNGNLLDMIIGMNQDYLRDSHVAVALNGERIADTRAHNDFSKRLDRDVCEFDNVTVACVPTDPVTAAIYIAVAVGVAVVASLLIPTPQTPNDAGSEKSSPNNQLSAANNSFRPRQGIPQIAGRVRSTPDFAQLSYYTYINNRRVYNELFIIGEGYYNISDVKDAETLFDDAPQSSYTIYSPDDTIPVELLRDIRTTVGSEDLPLYAPDDNAKSANISAASMAAGTLTLAVPDSSIIDELDITAGDTLRLDVQYQIDGVYTSLSASYGVLSVSGLNIEVSPATLPAEDGGTVFGTVTKTGGAFNQAWLTLPDANAERIRFHIKMPQGIRRGDGSIATVSAILEYQRLVAGVPSGSIIQQSVTFTGNTQEPQYATREFDLPVVGQWRARAIRVTLSLGDNAADYMVLERIESEARYSESFGAVTAIATERGTAAAQNRGASNKINLIAWRELELFDPITGTFDDGVYTSTRSFAQFFMYAAVKRGGYSLDNIDYESLFDIEADLEYPELGYFDFTFDDKDVDIENAMITICNAARVKVYRIGDRYTFVRDEAQDSNALILCGRNIIADSVEIDETYWRSNEFDSVEIKWIDPSDGYSKAYLRKRINLSTGAIEDGEGERLRSIDFAGCSNYTQALDRALFEVGKLRYVYKRATMRATSEALNLAIGQKVLFANPDEGDIVSAGEILSQDGATYEISEPFTVEGGATYYVYAVDSSGAVTASQLVTATDGESFTVGSAFAAVVADGYEVQAGSQYVLFKDGEEPPLEWTVTKIGAPDPVTGVTSLSLANYDERVYDYVLPEPVPDAPPPEPPAPPSELSLEATTAYNSIDNESCSSVSVSSTVTATGGSGVYTYVWTKRSGNGFMASGSNTATLNVTFSSVCPEDVLTGVYRCVVDDGTNSTFIDVTFTAENIAEISSVLAVTVSGGNGSVNNGSCVTVTASGTASATGGTGSYSFSWAKISGDGTIVSGSLTDTLNVQFPSLCPEDIASGVYRVTVNDGVDSVTADRTFTGSNEAPIA